MITKIRSMACVVILTGVCASASAQMASVRSAASAATGGAAAAAVQTPNSMPTNWSGVKILEITDVPAPLTSPSRLPAAVLEKIDAHNINPVRDGMDHFLQIKLVPGKALSGAALVKMVEAAGLGYREHYIPEGGDGQLWISAGAPTYERAAEGARIMAANRRIEKVAISAAAAMELPRAERRQVLGY